MMQNVMPGGTARDKIKTLAELGQLARDCQTQGRRVVLCHGVFDLLHMGHVRHLEAARREGDVLIVTVTADAYVNKGPGRPVFPERMRAEMLAAIGYVDWVGVNHHSSSVPVLDIIRPEVYVKGSDYENPEDDITGAIQIERETTEAHGGRLVFTKDVTFSSSNLINKCFDVYDPPLRDYLDSMRADGALPRLLELIERVKDFRVLVVGDAIIDEYQYVTPMGKSAKENMIATLYQNREMFAGGVIAAANHAAEFCREVEVVTMVGKDDSHEDLIRQSLHDNVKLHLVRREGAPTTRKCRFIDPAYMRKLFEVYHMDDNYHGPELDQELCRLLTKLAPDFDLVIVTDFGHGLITSSAIATLVKEARFLAVNAQSNSANLGFNLITKYPRADYICIDAPEVRLALSDRTTDIPVLASEHLPRRVPSQKVTITQGSAGCTTWDRDTGQTYRIPVFTKTVVDTVGAGDAFLAVTSPLVAAGGNMGDIGFIGNAVGAIKVGIVGHRRSIEKPPLVKYITSLLK
jgi:rfaE bifunctional protein nucleotidyltransferase chain/domain